MLTLLLHHLPCSLNPGFAALLARLQSLQQLVLDGNGTDDVAMQHIAAAPQLRWALCQVSGKSSDGPMLNGIGMSKDARLLRADTPCSLDGSWSSAPPC